MESAFCQLDLPAKFIKLREFFVGIPFEGTTLDDRINFLEKEDLRFDNLISKQNLLIKKLKEYRASVISHAVTGKIDVRELGA